MSDSLARCLRASLPDPQRIKDFSVNVQWHEPGGGAEHVWAYFLMVFFVCITVVILSFGYWRYRR